ncbi:MAG: IS66 family insertion sequence element accessory protein TnpB [Alphaproteobacteria bacterium]|nr:IS66 family insertion sequence element accessory protein TnpB [Alphaproteobacteria bacterium]
MLQITPQHRLKLAIVPVDFRKGIDGLVALCKRALEDDPFSGTIFAFRNRSGTSIKLLVYDGSGFWLCQKRFSKGKLAWWPASCKEVSCKTVPKEISTETSKTPSSCADAKSDGSKNTAVPIRSGDLLLILAQANPTVANIPENWREFPSGSEVNPRK